MFGMQLPGDRTQRYYTGVCKDCRRIVYLTISLHSALQNGNSSYKPSRPVIVIYHTSCRP